MIKRKILAIFICFTLSGFVFPVSAQTETPVDNKFPALTSFENISTTVKVIAYDMTHNGDIFPVQSGSATIISQDGLILTNNHVVQDEKDEVMDGFAVCLHVNQGKEPVCEYTATLIGRDKKYDIAMLKIDPTDARGNKINSLPYLSYLEDGEPKVGDSITIIGYPDIGGQTITTTQGVISGFSDVEDIKYLKSDTDISNGNSGGTVIDTQGRFIGIPTSASVGYSSGETLGYSLDIREARSWIDQQIRRDIVSVSPNNELIKEKQILIDDANYSGQVNYPWYPQLSFSLGDKWRLNRLEKSQVTASFEANDRSYDFNMTIERLPFTVSNDYLKNIFEKLEKNKSSLINYKRQEVTFAKKKGYMVTFSYGSTEFRQYFIPYGYALVEIDYRLNLQNLEQEESSFDLILKSFHFEEGATDPEVITSYTQKTPPFSIKTAGDFLIQKQETYRDKNTILKFLLADNFEGGITVRYQPLDEDEKDLSIEQLLDKTTAFSDFLPGFTLINKDTKVLLDGLKGWSLTYGYEGPEYQKSRKETIIFVRTGDYLLSFNYDDLDYSYDKHLADFKNILQSFVFDGDQADKGIYQIGTFNYVFKDIVNHRFTSAISHLKDIGIIKGYSDDLFGPERPISRAESLKIILESALYNKDKNYDKRGEIDVYKKTKYVKLDFFDVTQNDWVSPYARYARDKKLIQGYSDGNFKPNQSITLAESLVILLNAHEIKVWKPIDDVGSLPWYKSYMDKALELNLLPPDLLDPSHVLTRGEFTFIVDRLMGKVANSFF